MIAYQVRTESDGFYVISIKSSVLYIVRTDGTGKVRLDEVKGAYFDNIAWSPDGEIISYGRRGWESPEEHVFLDMGRGEEFSLHAVYYQWSPDSKNIVYHHSEGDCRIRTREGGEFKLGEEISPPVRWSCDGKKLYYMEKPQGNLVSMNLDGTEKMRLIPASIGARFEFVDVTPEKIIYQTKPTVDLYPSLWVADLDGTDEEIIQSDAQGWTIGEMKIAVSGGFPTMRQFVTDLKTMKRQGIGSRISMVFSPDEEWIAYGEKDEWGDYYIYTMNLDMATKTKLTEGSSVLGWIP